MTVTNGALAGENTSPQKMYKLLIGGHITPKPIWDIWKSCNVPRQKFFVWLLLHGRLNTKE
jgi:hypothetical protein